MPIKYSDNIPFMFGRAWTAPPEEVYWDMYENDASFDEASQNALDRNMADDYDLLGEDPFDYAIEDEDPDAVEKAIYQINVAMDNDLDPSGINTPYGPGLQLEEISALVEQYPGIEAGLELAAIEDYFVDADEIVKNAPELQSILDAVEQRTEAEGRIGEEPMLWGPIGDQLGNSLSIQGEDLKPLKGTATTIAELFSEDPEPQDPVANFDTAGDVELNQLLDLSLSEIYDWLRIDQTPREEVLSWINSEGFDAAARQQGKDPAAIRSLLEGFGLPTEELVIDDLDEFPQLPPTPTPTPTPTLTQTEAGTGFTGVPPEETDEWETKELYGEAFLSQMEEEGRNVVAEHTANLRKIFYTKAYAYPGVGRAGQEADLRDLHQDTKALFFLFGGSNIWGAAVNPFTKAATDMYQRGASTSSTEYQKAQGQVENAYDQFLTMYFSNPSQFRRSPEFRNRINLFNRLINLNDKEYGAIADKQIKTPEDQAVLDNYWVAKGLFGGEDDAARRKSLIHLSITNGSMDYYSRQIHGAADALMTYYKNIGKSDEEIFNIMTKRSTTKAATDVTQNRRSVPQAAAEAEAGYFEDEAEMVIAPPEPAELAELAEPPVADPMELFTGIPPQEVGRTRMINPPGWGAGWDPDQIPYDPVMMDPAMDFNPFLEPPVEPWAAGWDPDVVGRRR